MSEKDVQLSQLIDNSDPKNVIREVFRIFSCHYPKKYFPPVRKCFRLALKLFQGRFTGYQACNTEYHNLSHTLDALLCATRILDGYNIVEGVIPASVAVNLMRAALLHDCGYIQEDWDTEGTGAKYTSNHVERSVDFLMKHKSILGITDSDGEQMSWIIKSTGISVNMDSIPFSSPEGKIAGTILGTADLLGQMADRVYLEKLLFLYYEFREAGIRGFNTEYDIIRKTVDFYEVTRKKFEDDYMQMYQYVKYHFKERFDIDRNLYVEAIDRHIAYLRKIIADDTSNFRHKLKRATWVNDDMPVRT